MCIKTGKRQMHFDYTGTNHNTFKGTVSSVSKTHFKLCLNKRPIKQVQARSFGKQCQMYLISVYSDKMNPETHMKTTPWQL